jgi:hypothetical protein
MPGARRVPKALTQICSQLSSAIPRVMDWSMPSIRRNRFHLGQKSAVDDRESFALSNIIRSFIKIFLYLAETLQPGSR